MSGYIPYRVRPWKHYMIASQHVGDSERSFSHRREGRGERGWWWSWLAEFAKKWMVGLWIGGLGWQESGSWNWEHYGRCSSLLENENENENDNENEVESTYRSPCVPLTLFPFPFFCSLAYFTWCKPPPFLCPPRQGTKETERDEYSSTVVRISSLLYLITLPTLSSERTSVGVGAGHSTSDFWDIRLDRATGLVVVLQWANASKCFNHGQNACGSIIS